MAAGWPLSDSSYCVSESQSNCWFWGSSLISSICLLNVLISSVWSRNPQDMANAFMSVIPSSLMRVQRFLVRSPSDLSKTLKLASHLAEVVMVCWPKYLVQGLGQRTWASGMCTTVSVASVNCTGVLVGVAIFSNSDFHKQSHNGQLTAKCLVTLVNWVLNLRSLVSLSGLLDWQRGKLYPLLKCTEPSEMRISRLSASACSGKMFRKSNRSLRGPTVSCG